MAATYPKLTVCMREPMQNTTPAISIAGLRPRQSPSGATAKERTKEATSLKKRANVRGEDVLLVNRGMSQAKVLRERCKSDESKIVIKYKSSHGSMAVR
jgi:hypothetical protein